MTAVIIAKSLALTPVVLEKVVTVGNDVVVSKVVMDADEAGGRGVGGTPTQFDVDA